MVRIRRTYATSLKWRPQPWPLPSLSPPAVIRIRRADVSKCVELHEKLDSLSPETFKTMIKNLIASLLSLVGLALPLTGAHALESVRLKVSPLPKSFVDNQKGDFTVAYPLHLISFHNLHQDVNPIYQGPQNTPLSSTLSADTKGRETLSSSLGSSLVGAAMGEFDAGKYQLMHHLARLTAYWVGEDYYTNHHLSSTGVHLRGGHCAVDPNVIPYGSVVQIPGVGQFLAVDTGSAVVARTAARKEAHNPAERHALVVDLFFENRTQGEHFAAFGPAYAPINWFTPAATASRDSKTTHGLYAEEETNRQQL
jgi:3D (Asp-Asp-Asp) domain-containing protein